MNVKRTRNLELSRKIIRFTGDEQVYGGPALQEKRRHPICIMMPEMNALHMLMPTINKCTIKQF